MKMKSLKEFIFKSYYQGISFTKKENYYSLKKQKKKQKKISFIATKLTKNIPDPTKTKEHNELFLKTKAKNF